MKNQKLYFKMLREYPLCFDIEGEEEGWGDESKVSID